MVFYKSKLVQDWLRFSTKRWLRKILTWVYRNNIYRLQSEYRIDEITRERNTLRKQIDGMAIQIAKLTPEIDTLQNSD